MSFSENLQTLRKSKNISQEQLAERLSVSRQAVSKWETDGGYPEMDKIMQLCELFDCTMDELVKGKVSVDKSADRRAYDDHFNRFSKGIAIGVALIIFGTALTALTTTIGELIGSRILSVAIAPAALLMLVAAAVAIFIILGIEHGNFRKTHHSVSEIYTKEEAERFNTGFFPKAIAFGVALIIGGLVPTVIVSEVGGNLLDGIMGSLFLSMVAVAVGTFVYAGIQHSKYNVKEYNLDNINEYGVQEGDDPALVTSSERKAKSLCDKICGIIMLTATGVFLTIGFLTNEWHPTWAVFPLGGILCAIVNVALGVK